jgi:predicted house-cleaning noncanonical NTP pyrophosphatase (MazG superfamily)
LAALEVKLNEEVDEYQEDKSIEEMADVLEVLQAITLRNSTKFSLLSS